MKYLTYSLIVLLSEVLLIENCLSQQVPQPAKRENLQSSRQGRQVEKSTDSSAKVYRHVPYVHREGAARRTTSLDIYAPQTGKNHPILIWIHGGGWKIGDKRGVDEKPEAFVRHGFLFVSINYRLYPDADFTDQARDVAAAIAFMRQNAQKYDSDPNRIYLMGHSAGAHLAALVATDPQYLQAEKRSLADLKGVILVDGACYDIPRQIKDSRLPYFTKLYKQVFSEVLATQQAASPISHVARKKGIPPFLLLHVAARKNSQTQANLLARRLQTAEVSATVYAAGGKTHMTINREMGEKGDKPTAEVFRFLDKLERKK